VTLGEAQTELAGRGFDYLSSSRMTIMLNNAKNALEDEFDWPWLETTVTGTAPLTIPDLRHVLYVQDTTLDRELVGLNATQLAVDGSDLSQTGAPTHWWLDGASTLNVWPVTTSDQLQVRYVKYSPELSAASDTPLIPARYHAVWMDYAVLEAYKDSDNFESASDLLALVRQYRLPQMISVYAVRNRQNSNYQTVRLFSEDW